MQKSKSNIYLTSPKKVDNKDIIHLPMIKFNLIASKLSLDDIDVLIFTSKQAVKFADTIDKRWKDYPSIAVGEATKEMIEKMGGKVLFFPKNYYSKELSKEIIEKLSDKKLLYIRPKVVNFDTKGYLSSHGIFIKEDIIYETSCINYDSSKKPKKDSIIIFTSPSTIRCFLNNFGWDSSYIAIVIGESTREHLPLNVKYYVASKPTISSTIKKAFWVLESKKS